jgi:SPP1 gp7 family putative phage head morphogenesis protein
MIGALDDIAEEMDREIDGITAETEDQDARAAVEEIRTAAHTLTEDRARGVDVIGSALLLPLAAWYAYTAATGTEHLKRTAALGYDAAAEQLGSRAVTIDRAAVIRDVVMSPWMDGDGYAAKMVRRMGKDRDQMLRTMGQRIARGDIYEDIAKDMALGKTETAQKMMYKLIYTEGTHALNEASARAFEAAGDEEYEISIVNDSRVCPVCAGIAGKVFRLADREVGINFPPFHTGCRCSITVR